MTRRGSRQPEQPARLLYMLLSPALLVALGWPYAAFHSVAVLIAWWVLLASAAVALAGCT